MGIMGNFYYYYNSNNNDNFVLDVFGRIYFVYSKVLRGLKYIKT